MQQALAVWAQGFVISVSLALACQCGDGHPLILFFFRSCLQCGGAYTELSPRADLLYLDLALSPFDSQQQQLDGKIELQTSSADAASQLHAVVVWVDYDLVGEGFEEHRREQGAETRLLLDNGPNANAYSATQRVLLLPQQQQQASKGVRVVAHLEGHSMRLFAERI